MKARLVKGNLIITPETEKEELKLKKWFFKDLDTEDFFQQFTLEQLKNLKR